MIQKRKSLNEIKKVGWMIVSICTVFTALFLWRKGLHPLTFVFSSILFIHLMMIFIYPKALYRSEKFLIKVGHIIGYINSRIILSILFYLVFLPISVFLKLNKKNSIETTIDPQQSTYWIDVKESKRTDYFKRQF